MPSSDDQNVPDRNNETPKGQDRQNERKEILYMTPKWWHFVRSSAFWTAVFTGLLTVFTYKLYEVSNIATETSRSSERAVLNVQGLTLGAEIRDSSGNFVAQEMGITWSNTGSTPAKAMVIESNAKPELEDFGEGYDFPLLPDKSEGVIGPKGIYSVSLQIPRSVWEDNWRGKNKLFVYGTAIYRDAFPGDPERLSEFCLEITHVTVGWKSQPTVKPGEAMPSLIMGAPNTGIAQFTWQACKRGAHTCYDEDCKDYKERVADMRK
jgi:hypothetical protein